MEGVKWDESGSYNTGQMISDDSLNANIKDEDTNNVFCVKGIICEEKSNDDNLQHKIKLEKSCSLISSEDIKREDTSADLPLFDVNDHLDVVIRQENCEDLDTDSHCNIDVKHYVFDYDEKLRNQPSTSQLVNHCKDETGCSDFPHLKSDNTDVVNNSQRSSNKNNHISYAEATLDGKLQFQCNFCDYNSNFRSNITRHIKSHTGEKNFQCHYCEYKCIRKSVLRDHIKIHTREKNFQCHVCDYKCIRKGDLTSHLKIHTGEKNFQCHLCDYKCIRKGILTDHIKTHTKEKNFHCHLCQYKCIRKGDLTYHLKIHGGEKNFQCNFCEYKCIRRSVLRDHIKIHTREKNFQCHLCEYKFIRKGDLTYHLKSHFRTSPKQQSSRTNIDSIDDE